MTTMPDPETTYAGPGTPGRVCDVSSRGQAADLAAWLLSPNRRDPVLVVSHPHGSIPPDAVAPLVVPHIEVYTLCRRGLAPELSSHLPDSTGVYGNAARLYPADRQWQREPLRARLFVYSAPGELARFAAELTPRQERRAAAERHPGSSQPDPAPVPVRSSGAAAAGAQIEALAATGGVHRVDTAAAGQELARHLRDPRRTLPVVVLSVDPGADAPYFDADRIAGELRGVAAVVRIGADATYGLTDGLGDKRWSVFYGAGRVYPVGTDWLRDMHKAPLHLCFSTATAARATPVIVEEALVAAHAAGVLQSPSAGPDTVPAEAEVRGVLGTHHIQVRTADGRTAAMLAAHLRVGIPAERLVRKKQSFHGRFTATGGIMGEFVPRARPDGAGGGGRDPRARGAQRGAGGPGRAAREAVGLLHPDVPVQIVDTLDEDAGLMLSPGDVVGVEVVWDDGAALGALLPDPAPDELAPAIAVLPGGPPWLLPQDLAPDHPDPGPAEPEPQAAVAPSGATLPEAPPTSPQDRRIAELRDINAVLAQQAEGYRTAVDRLEATVRDLRRQLRRAAGKRSTRAVAPVWRDAEQQLRHEIALAYLDRVPEDERAGRPLPQDYVVGPEFIDSLERLQGISRDKVLRVVVECLTGLDALTPVRNRRAWLAYSGGPQERRADGASAWRVNMQSHAAAARRLKYWTLPDGSVELDSVGGHDEGLRSRRVRS